MFFVIGVKRGKLLDCRERAVGGKLEFRESQERARSFQNRWPSSLCEAV